MNKVFFFGMLFTAVFASADGYRARFELDSEIYKEGVRFVEFKTEGVDVAYKVVAADEDSVTFNIYFTNISKKTLTVDNSLFYIVSLKSNETVSSLDPDEISGVDKTDFFTKTALKPDESVGGQVRFSVKEATGRWALKNKLTANTFNFAVKEE